MMFCELYSNNATKEHKTRTIFLLVLSISVLTWLTIGFLHFCRRYLCVLLYLQILDEMPVFYNLNAIEKREVLIVTLQTIRNLDDASLIKAWQQSIARTRLFFKLLEECLVHFEVSLFHIAFSSKSSPSSKA